jgi:hypothetical protein
LEAAAVAIAMIERGELTAPGTEAALFLPEPTRVGVDWQTEVPPKISLPRVT